jgi:hypothetical protein
LWLWSDDLPSALRSSLGSGLDSNRVGVRHASYSDRDTMGDCDDNRVPRWRCRPCGNQDSHRHIDTAREYGHADGDGRRGPRCTWSSEDHNGDSHRRNYPGGAHVDNHANRDSFSPSGSHKDTYEYCIYNYCIDSNESQVFDDYRNSHEHIRLCFATDDGSAGPYQPTGST